MFSKVLNFVLRISDICKQSGYQEFIDTSFSQCKLKLGFRIPVSRVCRCLLAVGGIHLSHSGSLKVMVTGSESNRIFAWSKIQGRPIPILVVLLLHTRKGHQSIRSGIWDKTSPSEPSRVTQSTTWEKILSNYHHPLHIDYDLTLASIPLLKLLSNHGVTPPRSSRGLYSRTSQISLPTRPHPPIRPNLLPPWLSPHKILF